MTARAQSRLLTAGVAVLALAAALALASALAGIAAPRASYVTATERI